MFVDEHFALLVHHDTTGALDVGSLADGLFIATIIDVTLGGRYIRFCALSADLRELALELFAERIQIEILLGQIALLFSS